MGKSKSNKSSSRGTALDVSLHPVGREDAIDPSSLAAVLAADYPLIDSTLIVAILSDYPAEHIHKHVEEIRDQLGILEATSVPDPDDALTNESEVDTSTTDGELDAKLGALAIGHHSTGTGLAGGAVTRLNGANESGARTSGTGHSRVSSNAGASGSGSGSRSSSTKSTSPTSVHDEGERDVADELDLLKSLFPNTPVSVLREALSSETSISTAIDHLLSLELIRDNEDSGRWPSDAPLLSEDQGSSYTARSPLGGYPDKISGGAASAPASRSSSRARRKQEKHVLPIVDTLQRRPASRPPSRPTSRAVSPSRVRISRPTDNAWHTIASLAAYLSELVPSKPQSYFLAYFHAPDYRSAYAAARASLAGLPRSQGAGELETRAEDVLNEIYGGYMLDQRMTDKEKEAIAYDLKLCLNAAGGDVAGVMDLMDLLDEISLWPGDEDDLARYDEEVPSISSLGPQTGVFHGAAESRPAPAPALLILGSASAPAMPTKYVNPDRLLSRPKTKQPPPSAERTVPGSQAPTNQLIQTAHDDFGVPPSSPVPSSPKPLAGKQVHPQNWRTVSHVRPRPARFAHPHAPSIPSYSRGHLPNNRTPGSLFDASSALEPSIDECLSRAAAERAKREAAIREAGRHFRGSGKGGKALSGAVAGHYASQAREAMANARDWELKAARMVTQSQLDRSGNTAVDLHYMTVHEAVTVSLEAADRWWNAQVSNHQGFAEQSRDRTPTVSGFGDGNGDGNGAGRNSAGRGGGGGSREREGGGGGLTIVTGVGRHSTGQRGVLGPAVATALEGEGWRVDRGDSARGYLLVKGRRTGWS